MGGRSVAVIVAIAGAYACAGVTGISDYVIDTSDGGTAPSGSSSGTATSGGPDASSVVDPTAYLRASCAFTKRCLPDQFAAYYASDAACESEGRSDLPSVSQSQLDACKTKLESATCEQRERDFNECDFDPGTLADGATCTSSTQCKSGRCQRPDETTNCGTCAARQPLGAACAGFNDCATDLFCDLSSNKCAKRAPEGGTCSYGSFSCVTGLQCVSGKCKPAAALGGDCTATPGECRSDLSCVSKKCVEDGYVDTVNAKCGYESNNRYVQCVHLACFSNKCAEFLKVGEACTTDGTKPPCGPSLTCTSGKCADRVPASCAPDAGSAHP